MSTTGIQSMIEAFHAEHVRLGQELAELRDLTAGPLDWLRLESALARAEPLLEEHMAFEECDGYLMEVVEALPNSAGEVESLRLQHEVIRRELRELRRRVLIPADPVEMLHRLRSWLRTLAEHEGSENRLVQNAANEDIGAGD